MMSPRIKFMMAIGLAGPLACAAAFPAAAQKHVALVLDNGRIQAAPTTSAEPSSQTSRIAEGLEKMRYRVIFGRQQDKAGMRRYIDEFRGALSDAEIALFYFKGVTLDASGRNLLVANNATPGRPIDQSTIALDDIADLMTASRANLLLVDAGYADRTADALARSTSGLAPTMAKLRNRSRFMVAFANMPGKVGRSDADSPFAEILASYLSGKDITSSDLGQKLRQDVFERTRGSQLPWVRSDLGPVQLAALPHPSALPRIDVPAVPSFDRIALIRDVQRQLARHKCFSGSIDGNAALAQSGIDSLDKRATGKNGPDIKLASASFDEFQKWLEWSNRFKQPICAPAAAPVYRAPPRREPRVVQQYREPPRARPRAAGPSSNSEGQGRGLFSGDTHLPPNRGPSGSPFAPTR